MNITIGILFLTVFVEGFVNYTFGGSNDAIPRPWLKYVALFMGVLVCVAYGIDLPASVGLTTGFPFVGAVISGLIIGRGSNYLNDIVSKLIRKDGTA